MSDFDHDDDVDLPSFEDLKRMSKAEIQALVAHSRGGLESVVSMPEAVRSEKYNAIVSERIEAAENGIREAERLIETVVGPPGIETHGLAEAVTEASQLLEGDLLTQDDEGWRDTIVRLLRIGKEMSAAEKSIVQHRAEILKVSDALRPAEAIDNDIRFRSEGAIHEMMTEAGVDWRLMSKTRSAPPVDLDFWNDYRRAQVDFATKTPMDEENADRHASLKKATETLKTRIQDLQLEGIPPGAQEALRQRNVLQTKLNPIKTTMLDDLAARDFLHHGMEIFAKKAEKFGKEREELVERRSGLASAFLGKLRHGPEIKSLDWQIANLDGEISKNAEVMERFANEEKRKVRASAASAALRGVDLG